MRLWTVCVILLLIGCNEIRDCDLVSSTSFATVAFYEIDSATKYRKDTLIFNGTDTLLPSGGINGVLLELDPLTEGVNYGFVTDSVVYELFLGYNRELEIYYEECDPVYTYTLDSLYSPNFDSVVLLAAPLDKDISINVEVYF